MVKKNIWQGSCYKREGKGLDRKRDTWRNRTSGAIFSNSGNKPGRLLGYEPPRSTPYGTNIRTKSAAAQDTKTFGRNRRR